MTSEKDFIWNEDINGYEVAGEKNSGYYLYVGNEEVVTIPHEINGNRIDSYYRMFSALDNFNGVWKISSERLVQLSNIKKVISNNDGVVFMDYMFSGTVLESLDLSELSLTSVESMVYMFGGSNIESLNLSGLTTENIESAEAMFSQAKISEINSEHLVFSKSTNVSEIFSEFSSKKLNLSNINPDLYKRMISNGEISEVSVNELVLPNNEVSNGHINSALFEDKYGYVDTDILRSLFEYSADPIGLLSFHEIETHFDTEHLDKLTVPVTIDLKRIREEVEKVEE